MVYEVPTGRLGVSQNVPEGRGGENAGRKDCLGDRTLFQDGHVGDTALRGRADRPDPPVRILRTGVRKKVTNGIAVYRIRVGCVWREIGV